ncbi:EamA family transporter [Filimonas effusa]|uniref:EamA family transporter n=1 Tax=Filimonas effusa TaxID=2508721 RepID=A0A4Q1D8Y2_9BACT|nr:EamA family transporter [Filimonas effusa]RXK85670.1 EamA family transporter [Filimonas effusa]
MKSSMYYLAALTSFVIWGFFSLVLKPLAAYASLDILFYRVFLCAALMLVISLFFRRKALTDAKAQFRDMSAGKKWEVAGLTLGGALFLFANWFFFIYVMNHISVNASSFAFLVCPIMTTVLAFFLLRERLTKWQWVAVVFSVFSCVILSFNHVKDMLYGLVVAFTYALYLVSQRKNTGIDTFLVLTVQIVFCALLALPFYPAYREAVPVEWSFYAFILVIAVVFTIIPLFLNLWALQGITSSAIGILLYVNPLVNFLLAVAYYHEEVNAQQLWAYAIVLLSVIIFNEQYLFRRSRNKISPVTAAVPPEQKNTTVPTAAVRQQRSRPAEPVS